MLILKLQRGGLLLDLAGHSVTFTKIECASNYMHFWDHVSHGTRDRCIGRYISHYSTKYRWSIDRVWVESRLSSDRYIAWCIGRCIDQGTLKVDESVNLLKSKEWYKFQHFSQSTLSSPWYVSVVKYFV